MCVLLCRCSSSLRVNLLPQNIHVQTNGRSPECHRRWALRCDVFPYTFPQPGIWQMCCFFFPKLVPLLKCTLKQSYLTYFMPSKLTLHSAEKRDACSNISSVHLQESMARTDSGAAWAVAAEPKQESGLVLSQQPAHLHWMHQKHRFLHLQVWELMSSLPFASFIFKDIDYTGSKELHTFHRLLYN